MKFLLVASYPDSLLNFRWSLIRALQAAGLTVHVAAPDIAVGSSLRANLESRGVVVHDIYLRRTGTNPLHDLGTLLSLYRLIGKLSPDFFLGYTIKPVIYGTLTAFWVGVPRCFALITGLGYAFQGDAAAGEKQQRGFLKALVQRLYGLALRGAHKVFFQNPDDEALFRQLGILKPSVTSVVVNGSGVDVDQYAVVPLPTASEDGQLFFLLIARLLGDKGVREYVEAARLIKKNYPSVVFKLVGWIDENPDSIRQQELEAWIAEGIIEFLGRLSDVRPAIGGCSIYVLPSYREGTPRTVLEAMAMGRAIITTDVPGCRETVVDGDNGFLVPVKSVNELAAAMEKFIAAPELVERMGKRSRAIAESKYDVNAVNAVMLREMGITGKADV